MQLETKNPDLTDNNATALTQPAYAGATTLNVYNTKGFNVNDFYVLEGMGKAASEQVQITAVPNSNQLTVTALTQSHGQGAPIVFAPYNQVQIWRSITGSSGIFTLFSTIAITWDQEYTMFTDTTATSSYAYYTVFYNSSNSISGQQSSIVVPTGTFEGYDPNSLFSMKQRARTLLKDYYGQFVSEDELTTWANEKYAKLHLIAVKLDQDYAITTTNPISVNLNTQEYSLPSDFLQERYLMCTVDGGINPFPAKILSYPRIRNMQYSGVLYNYAPLVTTTGQNYVHAYIRNVNGVCVVGFWPQFTGSYTLDYYPIPPQLIKDSDIPYAPLNSFSYMLVNYMVKRAYLKSGREDLVTRVPYLDAEETKDEAKLKGYLNYRQTQYPQEVEDWDQGYLDPGNTDKDDSVFM